MPRIAGVFTPKYRKHRATGQAVVTIAARDHYLGPWRSKASLIEYDRLVGEWLTAGRPMHQSTPVSITVVELVSAYLRFVKRHYIKDGRATSEQDAIAAAMRPLKAIYGRTLAIEFGPLGLKTVRDRMVTEHGWARGTVNDNVSRIRRMFKWGASEQLIDESVWRSLVTVDGLRKGKTAARETSPILPVADAVVDATLPFLPPAIADMVRLQRLTGMRPGEVCMIRPCDVEAHGDVWRFVPHTHKTEHFGRARVIFIGPKAQDVLRPYLLRDKAAYCFSPAESERKRRALAHERRIVPLSYGNRPGTNRKRKPKVVAGDRYDVTDYRRAIARAVKRINEQRITAAAGEAVDLLQHWHPNQLRHTAATEIRRQFGLEAAQVTLGHSSADVSQIYAERDLQKAAAVMREVG